MDLFDLFIFPFNNNDTLQGISIQFVNLSIKN